MYYTTQNNTNSNSFSSLPPKNRNFDDFKVIYRTQYKLDNLSDIAKKHLKLKSSSQLNSAGNLFKIIIGRIQNCGRCITKQVTFAESMRQYNNKRDLSSRQIRRLIVILKDLGLITYKRSGQKWGSVYQYEATQLGNDMYYYVIYRNIHDIKFIPLELSTASVDNLGTESEPDFQSEKMSAIGDFEGLMNPWNLEAPKKNVRYNIDINIRNINININNHTRGRGETITHNFLFSPDPYPDPQPKTEIKLLSETKTFSEMQTFSDIQFDPRITKERVQILISILAEHNATPSQALIYHEEVVNALLHMREKKIQIVDFGFFAKSIQIETWSRYYFDVKPNPDWRDEKKRTRH